jgi:beta-xylosidase
MESPKSSSLSRPATQVVATSIADKEMDMKESDEQGKISGTLRTAERGRRLLLAAGLCLALSIHGAPQADYQAALPKPLVIGEWADISIVKDGDTYYLGHSSGDYYPGLPIWASKDLKSWNLVTYAIRETQPHPLWTTDLAKDSSGFHIQHGIGSLGGHITSAPVITGPWSAPRPTNLPPDGILADGGKGNRYHFGSGYRIVPLKPNVYEAAGTEWAQPRWPIPEDKGIECLCPEAPKVLVRNGYWYLLMAAGGTFGPSTSHMVLAARARDPRGPWEMSPYNPISRTLRRNEAWWSKGHGQLIEDPRGDWFMITHAIMKNFRSLGRASIIEPIEWTQDGWFRVATKWPEGWEEPIHVDLPLSDEFDGPELGMQWQFHKAFEPKRFRFENGGLILGGRGGTAGDSMPMNVQPRHRAYVIETEVELHGEGIAGLMLFSRPESHVGYGINHDGQLLRVLAGHKNYFHQYQPKLQSRRVSLRIVNDQQDVRFYYKTPAGEWSELRANGRDGKPGAADHRIPGGQWMILQPGLDVSMAASSPWNVRPSLFVAGAAEARFEYFKYEPLESDEELERWLKSQMPAGIAVKKGAK